MTSFPEWARIRPDRQLDSHATTRGAGRPEPAPRSYVVTTFLLCVMALVFAIEMMSSLAEFDSSTWRFDVGLLIRLGGISRRLVFAEAQWWRLITSPILHGGALHLFFNSLALFIIGPRLEGLVGKAWFFAIFAVSAFVGDLFSLLINSPDIVSVGASGGIMGLFATAIVVSFRLKLGSDYRTELQTDAARVLVPTLVPVLFISVAGGAQDGVDVAAHLGGALSGAGFGIYLIWRDTELEGLKDQTAERGE